MSDEEDFEAGGGWHIPRVFVLGLAWVVSTALVVTVVLRHMQHEGLLNEPAVAQRLSEIKAYRDSVRASVKSGAARALGDTADGDAADGGVPAPPPASEMSDEAFDLSVATAEAKADAVKTLETWLPYCSEGALMLLIGLGVGLATRMVVKGILIAALLFFVGLQYFAYQGVLEVQWGQLAAWVHHTVLNAAANSDWLEVIKAKAPSAGAAGLGYFLGLRS